MRLEQCLLCLKWFEPVGRAEQAPNRKGWFCSDAHRKQYVTRNRRLCLCCETAYKDANQIVCDWCHVNLYGGKSQRK